MRIHDPNSHLAYVLELEEHKQASCLTFVSGLKFAESI